ncbi:MAG: hypothetical protein DRI40_02085 [Chloroflexi bacterium]|nr:MAG: hypothetical protein DRI40_02085 [Chloroflexota bacterium]
MKKDVSFAVEGIRIAGEVHFPGDRSQRGPALCICHGIPSGEPPHPSDGGYPLLARKFSAAGYVTLIFNFRGTGLSGGDFDIRGWARDLESAIDWLSSRAAVDMSRLYLMGFSGGAAVSAYVAAHDRRVAGVILCACPADFDKLVGPQNLLSPEHFRRIGAIRDVHFPPSVDEWLDGFREVAPIRWVDKIAPRPVLLLHGAEDDVVRPDEAWRLYQKAREPKEMAIIKGAGHKLRLSQEAMDKALEWLGEQVN